MKKIILTLSVVAVLASCAAKMPIASQADVDRIQSKYPGYTMEDLNHGKAIFEQHCSECHKLKNPTKFSEEQLQKTVPMMVQKVNKKHPNAIDENSKDMILKYMITMSGHKK